MILRVSAPVGRPPQNDAAGSPASPERIDGPVNVLSFRAQPPAATPRRRLLIERQWPAGFSRRDLAIDAWLKELAPSPGLDAWYDRSAANWNRFRDRYFRELDSKPAKVSHLLQFVRTGAVSLISRDGHTPYGVAAALSEFIAARLNGNRETRS